MEIIDTISIQIENQTNKKEANMSPKQSTLDFIMAFAVAYDNPLANNMPGVVLN